MTRSRPQIGDILEVETPVGFAYLQYTHEEPSMGSLVRILPGLYQSRPKDVSDLVRKEEVYFTFYTLKDSLRKRYIRIISNETVPEKAKAYPKMRVSNGQDSSGKALSWSVVRADTPFTLDELRKAPRYTQLTTDLARLSVHAIWPHPLLVKRLAQGWTPEDSEKFRHEAAIAQAEPKDGEEPETLSRKIRHFLYFPKKDLSQKAATDLLQHGFSFEERKAADDNSWLVLVQHSVLPETETHAVRDYLESLAANFGGEYDGWEFPVKESPSPSRKPN